MKAVVTLAKRGEGVPTLIELKFERYITSDCVYMSEEEAKDLYEQLQTNLFPLDKDAE